MKGLMEQALGEAWHRLPPALQAHYRWGTTTERGHLDIDYPRFMQPVLSVLRRLGALVDRPGRQVATVVDKHGAGPRQTWRRTLRFADGRVIRFDSHWEAGGANQVVEYVKPWLGLRMAAQVQGDALHYTGVCFVLRLGRCTLALPQWLLGATRIHEVALDARHFAMDFRMMHPLLGPVFRYSGVFEVDVQDEAGAGAPAGNSTAP